MLLDTDEEETNNLGMLQKIVTFHYPSTFSNFFVSVIDSETMKFFT